MLFFHRKGMSSLQNSKADKGKIFEENIILKKTVDKMRRSMDDVSVVTMDDLKDVSNTSKSFWSSVREKRYKLRPALLCVVVALLLAFIAIYMLIGRNTLSTANVRNILSANSQKSAFTGGQFHDEMNCAGDNEPRSFPDIDYALFGYNIIRGYPLAVGHDPGLTRPIFNSDYTDKKLTADCRYFLPKGLVIVPDISCVTSFTSSAIQDQYQLTKSLSASAKIGGGGWGAKFSASAEYKKTSAEVGSKETVYINSQAKCDYYLSMIDDLQPPALTKSFLMMARALNTESDVFKLFDYYGTHYLKEVTFGARLVYENKMSKNSFKTLSESSFSVTASASYSGLARVEGSAGLSAGEQRQSELFRTKVETSTISVGAPPPPNGSTNQWASEVKENPVPTKYEMAGIEELFTKKFMDNIILDYERIYRLINGSKDKYCEHLKEIGVVDTCKSIESYTKFHDLKLDNTQFNTINADQRSCIKSCVQEKKCIAAVNRDENKCDLFQNGEHSLLEATKSVLVLFIDRLNVNEGSLIITNAELTSQARAEHQNYNVTECKQKCREDRNCIVFTSQWTDRSCKLYQQLAITEDSIKYKLDKGQNFLQFNTNKTLS